MNDRRQQRIFRGMACMLWVALCFGLTSAVYLWWLDHLVALTGAEAADWYSQIAGYLMQAAGMGATAWRLRRSPGADHTRLFNGVAALFAALSAPALLANTAAGVVLFGLAMNFMCGMISGFYLYAIAAGAEDARRGVIFGGGYALATVAVGLLALAGGDWLPRGGRALAVCVPLTACAAYMASRLRLLDAAESPRPAPPEASSQAPLALAFSVVVMISAVKNLGFIFPSADIEAGLRPELSRLPYAAGLLAAGLISDRSRKNGMVCAVAALILPFIMLGLSGEPVPTAIFWGLDYLFFGFFSVFRVLLFLDMAGGERRWALAPLGLVAGRLGDVAGTAVGLLLSGSRLALIGTTTALFVPTAVLFYRLYQRVCEPRAVRQRGEQEIFEEFCLHNDLSAREREVFRMAIDNNTNAQIAEALFITESTVKYHMRNVLQKAGCKNRSELQRKYTLALYPGLQSSPDSGHDG